MWAYISQAPLHSRFLVGSANGKPRWEIRRREEGRSLGISPHLPLLPRASLAEAFLLHGPHSCQKASMIELPRGSIFSLW